MIGSAEGIRFELPAIYVVLVVVLVIALGILVCFLIMLIRKNQRLKERLYQISNHDTITGLLNRNFFFTYFSEWSKAHDPADVEFALLFIDLDNFKRVNDTAGHEAGDVLLKLIADFFRSYADKEPDKARIIDMIARIGGDEFLWVLPNASSAEALEAHARMMLEDFSKQEEFQVFIRDFGVGLSIGGALFPSQTDDYNELVRFADIAMYKAKYGGKNNYVLYDKSMGDGDEGMALTVRSGKKH